MSINSSMRYYWFWMVYERTSGIWVGKHWWYIYIFIYLYFQETNHSLGIWEDIWFRLWGFLLEISWEDYGVSWDISFARTGSMELSRYTYVVSMSYNNNPSNFRTYIYIYMVYISNTHIYIYRITYNIYLLYIYMLENDVGIQVSHHHPCTYIYIHISLFLSYDIPRTLALTPPSASWRRRPCPLDPLDPLDAFERMYHWVGKWRF